MKVARCIQFLIFLLVPVLAQAQKTEMVNGREFIVHTVAKSETVYAISRLYNVSQDTIFAYNPTAKTVIKPDEVLKFPKPGGKVEQPDNTDNTNTGFVSKKLYTVLQGETLYSISQKFSTTVPKIQEMNPQLGEILRVGENIFVPVFVSTDTAHISTTDVSITDVFSPATCDSIGFSENTIDVALLLPFYGGINSKIGSEFYAGAKIAADSLAGIFGKKINLHVYDTKDKNDSDRVVEILQMDEMKGMDLVVGPLYASKIVQAAPYLSKLQLPMVVPFARNETLLESNPYLFKMVPSEKTVAEQTVAYFHKKYPSSAFILANPLTSKDSMMHVYYKAALQKYAGKDTVNYRFLGSRSGVAGNLVSGKTNIVIYPSSKEISVKDFLTRFNKNSKNNDIIVVGTEEWLNFTVIEADYYMNLKVHVPALDFENYQDSANTGFIELYRSQFSADPSMYSFRAFNTLDYFLRAICYYGGGLDDCVRLDFTSHTSQPFVFSRPVNDGGMENQVIRFIRFDEEYRYSYVFMKP